MKYLSTISINIKNICDIHIFLTSRSQIIINGRDFVELSAARRKPGPKPRRVPQNSVPMPASPSPSLAQLFAAADSPQRPSSGSEESSESASTHHKDGRPRNLGRGVSKPKKNTVASLLAQSRALGIKPTPTLDPSVPLSHQVSLLRSNILAAQLHASATGQDDKNQVQRVNRSRIIVNVFIYFFSSPLYGYISGGILFLE